MCQSFESHNFTTLWSQHFFYQFYFLPSMIQLGRSDCHLPLCVTCLKIWAHWSFKAWRWKTGAGSISIDLSKISPPSFFFKQGKYCKDGCFISVSGWVCIGKQEWAYWVKSKHVSAHSFAFDSSRRIQAYIPFTQREFMSHGLSELAVISVVYLLLQIQFFFHSCILSPFEPTQLSQYPISSHSLDEQRTHTKRICAVKLGQSIPKDIVL